MTRASLTSGPKNMSIRNLMVAQFQDIAGILTDGSGPLGPSDLKSLLARGWGKRASTIRSDEEIAIAGVGLDEFEVAALETGFIQSGSASLASQNWRSTQSVSSFGEAGTGSWAALRALPDQHRIWLARDQFGQQPLYYAERAGAIAVSTSLSWFYESGFVERQFDAARFAELVQLQFLAGGATPFTEIRRVSPGETLVIERGRIVDRLRRPAVPVSDRRTINHEAALDALDTYLSESLREIAAKGRQQGCMITGDLASTVMAVAMARRAKSKAYGFVPVITDDEKSRHALKARLEFAAGLGLEAVAVPIHKQDFWDRLPHISQVMVDPVADHASLLWDGVAQVASEMDVKLLLPTGGQELFGAYGRYRTAARPLWLGGRAMRSRGHLQGLQGLTDGPSDWRDGMVAAESKLRGSSFSRVQRLQLLDLATWLPNDTMLGEHQVFHGAGVDIARPYLDPILAGFAFALPDQLKLRGGQGGLLLRHWLGRTYPTALKLLEEERPSTPVSSWIAEKAAELGPAVDEILTSSQLMANGQAQDIFTLLGRQPSKRLGMAAWQLLSFACWYQIHVAGKSSDSGITELLTPSD